MNEDVFPIEDGDISIAMFVFGASQIGSYPHRSGGKEIQKHA